MTFSQDIFVPKNKKLSKEEKSKSKEQIEKEWKENSKLVKGVFHNVEAPGGDLEFAYKEYPQDPIRKYHLKDGESYTIPLGVARHLNRNCQYKRNKWLVDKEGKPMMDWDKSTRRYQFVSDDYI